VYTSADRYENPTDQCGYGIPNFEIALDNYTSATASLNERLEATLKIYPNPVATVFSVYGMQGALKDGNIQIFDLLGKRVFQRKKMTLNKMNISFLENGIYFSRISKENKYRTLKIIKK
jgi:hypothetical protein